MIQKKIYKTTTGLVVMFLLVCLSIGTSCNAAQQSQTTLDIIEVTGGFGKVTVIVKNIGDSTAENITIIIAARGGILNKINIEQICSGCDMCGTTIEPGATRSESTSEAGFILGFGPITITTSAEAANTAKVEKTFTGFVLGPFVIPT